MVSGIILLGSTDFHDSSVGYQVLQVDIYLLLSEMIPV